jgi:hypothetical protein
MPTSVLPVGMARRARLNAAPDLTGIRSYKKVNGGTCKDLCSLARAGRRARNAEAGGIGILAALTTFQIGISPPPEDLVGS